MFRTLPIALGALLLMSVFINKRYIDSIEAIPVEKASEIARNSKNAQLGNALAYDPKQPTDRSIESMHKVAYNLALKSATPKEMVEKFQLLKFIQAKFPFNYRLKNNQKYALFNYDIIVIALLWSLFLFYKVGTLKDVGLFVLIISGAFLDVFCWKGVSEALVFTLIYFSFPLFLLFSGTRVMKETWGKSSYQNFIGFSFIRTVPISVILTMFFCALYFVMAHFPISDFSTLINEFVAPTIFYFIYPGTVLFLLTTLLICLQCGLFISNESICIVSLNRLPILYKKNELKAVEVKNNKIKIQLDNNEPEIVINHFYMPSKVYYQKV